MSPRGLAATLDRALAPAAVRLALGAVVGAVIAARLVEPAGPWWRVPLAAAVLALIALGAPALSGRRTLGGPPVLALGTLAGLYVGVPETNHIVGAAVGIAPFALGAVIGDRRTHPAVTIALGAALVWAWLYGAGDRPPAVGAGVGTFGLLAVAVAAFGGGSSPARGVAGPVVATALHTAAAVVLGRRGAVSDDRTTIAVTVVVGLAALALAARLTERVR